MNRTETRSASRKVVQLRSKYQVELVPDWGYEGRGRRPAWRQGSWSVAELDRLQSAIGLLANGMGGAERFTQNLGGVTIQKRAMGSHGGEALAHRVGLSSSGAVGAWTVVHELAHAWDANHAWNLSAQLEKYTGGYTNRIFALIKKLFGNPDSGLSKAEDAPGRRGRLPGCNAAGYFYGDQPSGSNWAFNRKEDFAESVAMYIGWGQTNDLSAWARARITRYEKKNGARLKGFGADNWADYAKYFYPAGGDYAVTARWKFVDDLMHARIELK